MHIATFRTSSPIGALCRALDEMARAGFILRRLKVEGGAEEARVKLAFDGEASITPRTYMDRLARMPSVIPVDLSMASPFRERVE